MYRRILFVICCVSAVASISMGRDDPFVPVVDPKDSTRPYYGETEAFDKAQIELPDNAKLIQRVEITYQNADGSIESKSIPLSGQIDSRAPVIISQETAPKASAESTSKVDNEAQQSAVAPTKPQILQRGEYSIQDKTIFIAYRGEMIRNFKLPNPYRIVFDFKPNGTRLENKIIALNQPYFNALKYGLHNTFIRIVIVIDDDYAYNFSETENGIIVNVK